MMAATYIQVKADNLWKLTMPEIEPRLTLGVNNSTTFGTGLSLTYKYKSNFLWKVFVDYDYSNKKFTLTYDPLRFMKVTTPDLGALLETMDVRLEPSVYEREKKMHYVIVGGSFAISF